MYLFFLPEIITFFLLFEQYSRTIENVLLNSSLEKFNSEMTQAGGGSARGIFNPATVLWPMFY